ncbi:hypothetical protein SDRG_15646 [Saprolegnia diclina VS20]|uniref:Magnesium transporter n=1 Tax=Saprolegnia diclina (strain VS20) TaxID=1156394 RepID=T0PZN6_SAPDV|nr:hypothetical protein SDRG_15646 [Saprolegnia diclina VS20]EQC26555.1 hypothetical protein SDRG_15646 [Saprolegnia diclina VS20]|eukprot:XP_008620048.1 hypothetical protein SDRG_15646 [Saprolegnia diclina VS20]
MHMRDLRQLDEVFTVSNEPSLSVRRQAILLNADPIRAVILRDNCLVFLPSGADNLASKLDTLVQEHVKASNSERTPFELRALEVVLAAVCSGLVMDGDALLPTAQAAVERMSRPDLPMGDMEALRALKKSLHENSTRVGAVRRMLVEALDKEDDLRRMQLTVLDTSPVHETLATETVEAIIETYLHDLYATQTRVALMLQRIQSTEDMVLLQLQTKRNSLLVVDLTLSMVATLVAVPNFVVGGFGMNLDSTVQTTRYMFWIVFGFCIGFPILAFHVISVYLSRRGIVLRL